MELEQIISPEAQDFIQANEHSDLTKLLLSTQKYPDLNIPLLVDQIRSRNKAKNKLPSWYQTQNTVFPPPLSMEQCSSEATASYKASLISGDKLIDMTGGTGVDASFMSRNFKEVTYVERQKDLVEGFRHNAALLGIENCTFINEEANAYLGSTSDKIYDWIYLDPARRDQQKKKVIALEDCEPDVSLIQQMLLRKSDQIMVKLSPMLDIQYTISKLLYVKEVHIVAVQNECKELLVTIENGFEAEPKIYTVNLQQDHLEKFDFYWSQEKKCLVNFGAIETYLYEPNAAVMKAGAFKTVALALGLKKLGKHTHLYTANTLDKSFPGKVYKAQESYKPNKKILAKRLKGRKASIKTRNYPESAESIRKKFSVKEGVDLCIFFCETPDGKTVIETLKID